MSCSTGRPAEAGPVRRRPLAGPQSVAVVFEKQSTRTRLSFDAGIAELGGHPIIIDARSSQLGRGETIEDTAQVLSRYVAAIVIRTFGQDRIEALAAHSGVPVVNALTDLFHPCQILADLLTIREHSGALAGQTLTYLGDGNNMAQLAAGRGRAGGHARAGGVAAGYQPDADVVKRANAAGAATGGSATVFTDVAGGLRGRRRALHRRLGLDGSGGRVRGAQAGVRRPTSSTTPASAAASDDVLVLHCLPAHRGEEIAAAVMDGPHCVVFDQAENRLHAQKALLVVPAGHRPRRRS